MATQHSSTDSAMSASQQFDALFTRYEKGIFNLIYRMVGDYEDATDLTSQTFLHALRGFQQFRGESQTYTWLYRIAVNLCKNHFRKRDREARYRTFSLDAPLYSEQDDVTRELDDDTYCPTRVLEGRELQQLLQQALLALPEDLRAVIVLRDVQGLTYQEIAEITHCSLEAVKSRIFRARGSLRKALGPQLRPESTVDVET